MKTVTKIWAPGAPFAGDWIGAIIMAVLIVMIAFSETKEREPSAASDLSLTIPLNHGARPRMPSDEEEHEPNTPYDLANPSPQFLAESVGEVEVMQMLNRIEPLGPHTGNYGELSKAIALAASADPLFPWRPDGCRWTAAVLVAIAWHESRFHPNLIGDQGRSFGLFQIQPGTAQIDASILLKPADASYVAIDLVRQSMYQCRKKPWEERLSWYTASAAGCEKPAGVVRQSLERMITANEIMKKQYPPTVFALPPAPET